MKDHVHFKVGASIKVGAGIGEDAMTVGIAELKAKLSQYLRVVREGRTLIIKDRSVPVAKIVPFEDKKPRLEIIKGKGGVHKMKFPPPLGIFVDVDRILAETREDRV